MKYLFFLNHPAHFHLFKNTIEVLKTRGYVVDIVIVKKDILETLLQRQGWEYHNIVPEGRRRKGWPILLATVEGVVKTEIRLFSLVRKNRYDILIGTEATIAHVGWLLGVKSILVNEDDTKATPENYLFYPFASQIIMPNACDVGKWKKKKATYQGYHELAYLHPKYFTPRKEVVDNIISGNQRYFILRLAELTASHDVGKTGINDEVARNIIEILSKHGKVFITSERQLKPEFEPYRLSINPLDIFDVIHYADMYIGDSQTMAAEAAVLGTPSIRFNDFVGRLGYLEELEHRYGLTFGIKTEDLDKLYEKIEELLMVTNLKQQWQTRREKMLKEQVDVAEFLTNIFDQQPTQQKVKV